MEKIFPEKFLSPYFSIGKTLVEFDIEFHFSPSERERSEISAAAKALKMRNF